MYIILIKILTYTINISPSYIFNLTRIILYIFTPISWFENINQFWKTILNVLNNLNILNTSVHFETFVGILNFILILHHSKINFSWMTSHYSSFTYIVIAIIFHRVYGTSFWTRKNIPFNDREWGNPSYNKGTTFNNYIRRSTFNDWYNIYWVGTKVRSVFLA